MHRQDAAQTLIDGYLAHLDGIEQAAARFPHRPKVYFEEWDEPTISGIEWVSELIEIAGGEDLFADRSTGKLAKERFVSTEVIVARQPEVVLASWCGKPFDEAAFRTRFKDHSLPAIESGHIYEIP